jgi:transposase-like protein
LTSSGRYEIILQKSEEGDMARRYSAKFKFQVVKELLSGDKSAAQVAKAYGIHPNTARNWKKTFLEKGPDIFAEDNVVAQYERRIAELEQLVGKKEVEIALLKGFLGSGT